MPEPFTKHARRPATPSPPLWHKPLADYGFWSTAGGATLGTQRVRMHYLRRLAAQVSDPWSATLDDLVAFLAVPEWSAETRHSARAAVRSFYAWAELTERIDRDPARRLPSVTVPAGLPRPAPTSIVRDALDRATERERLMMLLASHAGLRRAEIAKVHTRDVVDGTLRVLGKGGKVRPVPLSAELEQALRALEPGYAFPGQHDGHLSPNHVGKLLSRLLGPGWTGHTLRHRFATLAYDAERDLLAVQQLLGHSKPETTARYTQVANRSLTRAVMAAATLDREIGR